MFNNITRLHCHSICKLSDCNYFWNSYISLIGLRLSFVSSFLSLFSFCLARLNETKLLALVPPMSSSLKALEIVNFNSRFLIVLIFFLRYYFRLLIFLLLFVLLIFFFKIISCLRKFISHCRFKRYSTPKS